MRCRLPEVPRTFGHAHTEHAPLERERLFVQFVHWRPTAWFGAARHREGTMNECMKAAYLKRSCLCREVAYLKHLPSQASSKLYHTNDQKRHHGGRRKNKNNTIIRGATSRHC